MIKRFKINERMTERELMMLGNGTKMTVKVSGGDERRATLSRVYHEGRTLFFFLAEGTSIPIQLEPEDVASYEWNVHESPTPQYMDYEPPRAMSEWESAGDEDHEELTMRLRTGDYVQLNWTGDKNVPRYLHTTPALVTGRTSHGNLIVKAKHDGPGMTRILRDGNIRRYWINPVNLEENA